MDLKDESGGSMAMHGSQGPWIDGVGHRQMGMITQVSSWGHRGTILRSESWLTAFEGHRIEMKSQVGVGGMDREVTAG